MSRVYVVGRLWRTRCLDPRGETASSRLAVGFDCAKVISVSGKSALVSENVAVGRIGKRGPRGYPPTLFYSGNRRRSCSGRNLLFITIGTPAGVSYPVSDAEAWFRLREKWISNRRASEFQAGQFIYVFLKINWDIVLFRYLVSE